MQRYGTFATLNLLFTCLATDHNTLQRASPTILSLQKQLQLHPVWFYSWHVNLQSVSVRAGLVRSESTQRRWWNAEVCFRKTGPVHNLDIILDGDRLPPANEIAEQGYMNALATRVFDRQGSLHWLTLRELANQSQNRGRQMKEQVPFVQEVNKLKIASYSQL